LNSVVPLDELASGEGQTVEFKKSLSQCDRGLEALCGMINADLARGAVWFGVRDDGQPVGIRAASLDRAQRKLSRKMQKFDPPVEPVVEVIERAGKRFIRVSAVRSKNVSCHEYDGRAFIREGSITRKIGVEEGQALQRSRNRDKAAGP
jgi:predicted HTH transcriptional regulator